MVGMAVGVDYSLFYLQREREERRSGKSPHESLLRTAATSGQAVLISGATVLIAMAGMLVRRKRDLHHDGRGTMIVVLCALLGSLSVLPALLHKLGDRVDRGRCPTSTGVAGQDRFWTAVVRAVLRRPVFSVVVDRRSWSRSRCRLSSSTRSCRASRTSRKDLPIVQAYADVQHAFPGSQTPVVLVVKGETSRLPQYRRAYAASAAARSRRASFPPSTFRQQRQDGRARRVLDRGQGRRQGVESCAPDVA